MCILKEKLWILGVILSLVIISACVIAECDEERIRIAVSDLIVNKAREVNTNVDNSFKAYEQFNSEQLAQFTSKVHSNLQQGVIFGLVALFAIILFTMSLWSIISLKVQKRLTTLMVDDIRSLKKILEQKSVQVYEPVSEPVNVPLPPETKPQKRRGLFRSKEEKQAEKDEKLAHMKQELEERAKMQEQGRIVAEAEARKQALLMESQKFEQMQHDLIEQQKRLESMGAQFDVPADTVAEEENRGDIEQEKALLPPIPRKRRQAPKPAEQPDGGTSVSTGYEFDADADSETAR